MGGVGVKVMVWCLGEGHGVVVRVKVVGWCLGDGKGDLSGHDAPTCTRL